MEPDPLDFVAAARLRVQRNALLPHVQHQYSLVAGALKLANLYDHVIGVARLADELAHDYNRRFTRAFCAETRRVLLVNQGAQLCDGPNGGCEALALPHLRTAVLIGLTGPPRVVVSDDRHAGAAAVIGALAGARVPFVIVPPRE